MNVAIIGCGLIGQKRAKALAGCQLVATADVDLKRAQTLAATVAGATASADWREVVQNPDGSRGNCLRRLARGGAKSHRKYRGHCHPK